MNKSTYVDGSVYSSSQFAGYAAAIRARESSDRYSIVLGDNVCLGAYQLGYNASNPALEDAGFIDAHHNWTPLAKSFGVDSVDSFLSNHEAQDVAFQNYTEKNFGYIQKYLPYVGKTIGGVYITIAGLIAGAQRLWRQAMDQGKGAPRPAIAKSLPTPRHRPRKPRPSAMPGARRWGCHLKAEACCNGLLPLFLAMAPPAASRLPLRLK